MHKCIFPHKYKPHSTAGPLPVLSGVCRRRRVRLATPQFVRLVHLTAATHTHTDTQTHTHNHTIFRHLKGNVQKTYKHTLDINTENLVISKRHMIYAHKHVYI